MKEIVVQTSAKNHNESLSSILRIELSITENKRLISFILQCK
jgi:hypothetical protein